MRTIAIVGAGAVGIYYGCRMVEAGHDVRFLLRSDYEVVKKKGFTIASKDGDYEVCEPQVYQDPRELGPVDLVVIAWKSTANAATERIIGPLLHQETRILTLQNGLGNVELLEGLFGRGRVLGGLCFVGINRLAAGQISHTVGGMVTIGEPQETGILTEMPALFGSKVDVKIAPDLALAQWRKLVWNIPFNGLCVSEGGIDTQELLQWPGKPEEVTALMQEVRAIAQALGHDIPESFLQGQLTTTIEMGGYKPSSMLDYVQGYPLEVEAIWGEPVRMAEQAQVAVPRLRTLYERLLALDAERQAD